MKKRMIKRKKKLCVYKKRKGVGRMLALAAAVCLFAGTAVLVHGEETDSAKAPKTVITNIYHRHIGEADTSGGCYSVPVNHVHQGDERMGGACYQTPVQHIHQGSADTEGGCYVAPVYHEHQGNETQGGACYIPSVIHGHTDACFVSGTCMVCFTPESDIETKTDKCFQHLETTFVSSRGSEVHGSCGKGTVSAVRTYCQSCGVMSPTVHAYQNKVCGLEEGDVVSYQRNCSIVIDRYETGCGKTEGEVESYALSCTRSLDGYGLGCGLDESTPCGRLIVTNETAGREEQVILSVKLEDLSGGKLKVSSNPYTWQDENGNQLGNGARITVDKNGIYSVTVKLENKDVDEKGLSSKIPVDNIYKAQPTASATPGASPSGAPEPSAAPAPSDAPQPSATPVPTPEPSAVPAPEPDAPADTPSKKDGEDGGEEMPEEEGKAHKKKEEIKIAPEEGGNSGASGSSTKKFSKERKESAPSPSPAVIKPVIKETREVALPEMKAPGEIPYKVEQKEKRTGFFADPAVRVITITTGMTLLLLGISLLFLYLRRSVKVYNDDGEGRMIYLGRCIVREEEDTYAVTITEAMVEKAYTNRYCIRPGLFRIGKKEGEELVVHKESKSIAVYLSREMIMML